MSAPRKCHSDPRLVGDPIDVVTGANVDSAGDLYLVGPVSLDFTRYYHSADNERQSALGWGHAHEFERFLHFDLDGIELELPGGTRIAFAPIAVGERTAAHGLGLERTDERTYWVTGSDVSMQFRMITPQLALLRRMGNHPHFIELEYTRKLKLQRIVDAAGRELQVKHNEQGLLASINWVAGKRTSDWLVLEYEYDERGNLTRGTDAYGNEFTFRYDSQNRMTCKTDRSGHSFYYRYDALGRCVESRGADGLHEVKLAYHPGQNCTEVTRGDGGTWLYFYNELGAITQIIDPSGGKVQYELDDEGRIVSEIDPGGTKVDYVYDDEDGELVAKQDGLSREWGPDEDGRPQPVEAPLPLNPAEAIFGEAVPVSGRSDALGHHDFILGIRPPRLQFSRSVEKSNGLLVTREGKTYDHFGNLVRESDPQGGERRFAYDANGCMTSYVDRDGSRYSFEYDSWNILRTIVDPLGNRVEAEVNSERFINKTTDAAGHTHEFTYDLNDRLVEVRRFDQVKESYEYDLAGNLTRITDGQDRVLIEKQFGDNNLLQQTRTADGRIYRYEHDDNGQTVGITADDHRLELGQTGWGHRRRDFRDGQGVVHEYDEQLVKQTTVFDRFKTGYGFDENNARIIVDPTGQRHVLQGTRNRLESQFANGSRSVSQFDEFGRTLSSLIESGDRKRELKYRYSGEGYLRQLADSQLGVLEVHNDAAHRIERIEGTNGSVRFQYDACGNLLSKPGLDDVSIGPGNQIQRANGESFSYNHRNAMCRRQSADGVVEYRYDAEDNLVSVHTENSADAASGEAEWRAEYDACGRRIRSSIGPVHREFFWDNDRLAAEVLTDGTFRVYVYSGHLAVTPLLFVDYENQQADPESGRVHYVHSNHLGAPLEVQDQDGQVVWQAAYDAYGQASLLESQVEFNLRLPGQYYDPETGLHYNRHRYYDPRLGRYLQADPIGLGGGINLYAYCHNPLSEYDLNGLSKSPPCGGSKKSDTEPPENTRARNRRHPGGDGITRQHLKKLRAFAKKAESWVIFRKPNPASKQYQGKPGYRPKPMGLPTGDVENPKTKKPVLGPDGEPIRKCSTDPDDGLVKWRDPHSSPDPPYSVDKDGNLLLDGDKIYSDYDLENVHDLDGKPVNYNTDNPKGQKNVEDINEAVHGTKDVDESQQMVQHGPNGQYKDDKGNAKLPPKPGEEYTAISPDGEVMRFNNPEQLKEFYDANDLDWPY